MTSLEGFPLIIQDDIEFRLYSYKTEMELEDIVGLHTKQIFGNNSVYLNLKRKLTSKKGISGIPDGFLLDFERNKLFIVEVELSSHDIIGHITNQLFRFKVAMNNAALREDLAKDFFNQATGRKTTLAEVQSLMNAPFGIAILIDNVSEKLVEIVEVLSQDGTDVIAVPFETYIDSKNNKIFKFTTYTKEALEKEAKKWTFNWTTVPIETHLQRSSEDLREIFNLLSAQICSISGVSQKTRKKWVTFQTSPLKNFCTVKFLPDALEVSLKCDSSFRDSKGVSKTIKRTPAWTFDRVFLISSKREIDHAMNLIRQAHSCICA